MALFSLTWPLLSFSVFQFLYFYIADTNNSANWPPLYGGPRLDQDTIQYIHKFYCKDCQMDQQAAERAKAEAAGAIGLESKDAASGDTVKDAEVEVEVKQEQAPVSPQTVTDDASIMQAIDKNKECKWSLRIVPHDQTVAK